MLKISVIVPMRNEQAHINSCLQSLLHQTLPPDEYEIIVVDGESEDSCAEMVRAIQTSCANLMLQIRPDPCLQP